VHANNNLHARFIDAAKRISCSPASLPMDLIYLSEAFFGRIKSSHPFELIETIIGFSVYSHKAMGGGPAVIVAMLTLMI
jgi:hypothetical protein